MTDSCYNIAIIGQTGVGKSSLLNYLFGFDESSGSGAKTGIGRPVTKNGFHQFDVEVKGNRASVYDSWGLEVGKEAEWMQELDHELKKRGVDKAPADWFHSVFYCIAAAGARIQDADIKIIKKLIDQKYQVSIILTKTDCLSEGEERDFISVIKSAFDHNISVTPVCSVSKKTRSSEVKPFGREEVHHQSFINLVDSLIERVPAHCGHKMSEHVKQWKNKMYSFADSELGYFGTNNDEVEEKIKNKVAGILTEVQTIGDDSMRVCIKEYQSIANFMQKQLSIPVKKNGGYGEQSSKSSAEWSELLPYIPLALISIPFLPFIMRYQRESTLDEIKSYIDKICTAIQADIQKQADSIRGSLESLKMQSDSMI